MPDQSAPAIAAVRAPVVSALETRLQENSNEIGCAANFLAIPDLDAAAPVAYVVASCGDPRSHYAWVGPASVTLRSEDGGFSVDRIRETAPFDGEEFRKSVLSLFPKDVADLLLTGDSNDLIPSDSAVADRLAFLSGPSPGQTPSLSSAEG